MPLTKDVKTAIVKEYGDAETDTGSCKVQIALLTERINSLSSHFKAHVKDNHSRRGLLMLVSKRRRLLNYIQNNDSAEYQALIERLKLRK
jgi:small subunit ribosomal protein S15